MAASSFGSGFKTGFGSAFLQFSLERIASFGSFAWKEISVIWDVEDELRKLQRTFLKIQDLVDFVEGSPFRFSGSWQMWFEDIRKLAYDADALLDHISLHLSSFCAENSVKEKQVRSMVISSFHNVQIPHMITEMQKKLDELAKEMESLVAIEKVKFDAKTTLAARSSHCRDFHFEGSSFIDDTTMVGREGDRVCIVDFLRTKSETNNFSVMLIVGIGGIGKTALTQVVYNSEELPSFDLKIWVSVSMDFDVVRITKSIIEDAIIGGCNISNLNALQLMLKGILCEKKFFLVLDDYWSEKRDDWSTLSWPFRFGGSGSKVIVTTRSSKASFIVSPENVHKLDILSDGDCWELIRRRASVASQNLVQIGVQIARKCKGSPLAATVLGSMLHGKYTEEEWHYVLENELGDMPQAKNVFLNLMRSYLYLPAHLKKCFAYCAIFPQDYEFEMEELVHLWMAEGFIQLVGGSRRLEDLGRDYFNDLYSRSLFEQCMSTSGQLRYKMHDLILDMARLVSEGICFHGKNDSEGSYPLFGNTCHLCLFHDTTQPLELKAYVKNERLRTFLVMSNAVTREIHPQLFAHLQFLRVLGLAHCGLTELTSSVDHLIYLRYLNLSENRISYLPESICKLVALQILKLRNCSELRDLPKDIKNLFNLQLLDMDIKGQLQVMPKHFGKLSNLQSLSAYIVGAKKGNGIEELKNMKWLRGSLCIKDIHFVSKEEDAKEAALDQKTCLDKLELQWKKLRDGLNSQLLDQRRSEQATVLESLCPHENLKHLLIINYCGVVYPTWLSLSSRNFTSIHLQGLKYCVHLPSLGELPLLKSFVISDMPCLEYVDRYLYGSSNGAKFPSLESFEIHDMLELKEWIIASSAEGMPCIETFTIHDCPKLTSLPRELRDLPNSNIINCPLLP